MSVKMKALILTALAAVLMLGHHPMQAQTAPYPGRANYGALKYSQSTAWFNYLMLQQHLRDDERREELQEAMKSRKDMMKYIGSVREKMQQLLGEMPERGDLKARITGTVEGDGFKIDKVIFLSRPGHYVTGHLYLPLTAGPHPACVEMCGHGLRGKGNGSGTAIQMARNGIAVLVTDPIGQGEMQQLIDTDGKNLTRGVTTAHTLVAPMYNLLGSSLAAQHAFDNSRAIDYLVSRPDIASEHIGCYGFSGGGTEASYLLALDDRVQCASVGLFFSDRTRTLETQGPSDGCQWIPSEGALGINHADMALCMAPRPFQILDGLYDFVDHYGALSGMKELKQAYTILGASDKVDQYYCADGHACPPDAMERLVGWFRHWLAGITEAPIITEVTWQGRDMLCTKSGQVNLEFADAESSMQDAMRQYKSLSSSREAFCSQSPNEVRRGICRVLGIDESFLTIQEIPTCLPGSSLAKSVVASGRTHGRDFEEYRFQLNREGEMPVPVIVRIPSAATASSPIELHLHEQGKASFLSALDKSDMTTDGRILVAADVRGVGELEDPYTYNLTKYWNREYRCAVTALHEGRPLIGQRVVDVMTLLSFCSSNELLKGHPVQVVADGIYGPVVMHAAVLDNRITKATLTHTLKTWYEYLQHPMQRDMYSNVIQGVLRYYDLPDLISLSDGRVNIID